MVKYASVVIVTHFFMASGLASAAFAESSFDSTAEAVLPAPERQFEAMNEMIEMAPAWGDRGQGAHGTFGRFKPHFQTPFHTHSGAYHAVVLSGTMTNPFADEEDPPTMHVGSYWYVPSGAVHATACVSDVPCSFYFHAENAFDFTPIE